MRCVRSGIDAVEPPAGATPPWRQTPVQLARPIADRRFAVRRDLTPYPSRMT